jgi:hypothetical protein
LITASAVGGGFFLYHVRTVIIGLVLFAAALALRSVSGNRHVRGRLFGSALAFAAYALAHSLLNYADLTADFRQQIVTFAPLLLAWGVISGIVAIVANPWRGDRTPDRFPQHRAGRAGDCLVSPLPRRSSSRKRSSRPPPSARW